NIIGMTHIAARMISKAVHIDWRSSAQLIGQPVSRFFNLAIDDLPELTRGRPTEERLIFLKDGTSMFGHAISPHHNISSVTTRINLPRPLQVLSDEEPQMRQLEKAAAKLSNGPASVLIAGETGSGKERLARAMHHSSLNPSAPFVVVNCAAISEEMIEQVLFGIETRQGLIQSANGGTLFLDEVGDLTPAVQARLLKVLSDGELPSVDNLPSVKLRIKIISATERDVSRMIEEGTLKSNFYFHIAAATLRMPPLRERTDFDWLLDKLLRQRAISYPRSYRLSAAARLELKHRAWPGNIRELVSALDVALAMSESEVIDLEDLPKPALPESPPALRQSKTLGEEADDLKTALKICGWNISRTARYLGINRTTVHRRMERLGIQRPH
ncbi:MAG: sigma 54-interacting transcriptional regulator, partial [Sneathiella sp.]